MQVECIPLRAVSVGSVGKRFMHLPFRDRVGLEVRRLQDWHSCISQLPGIESAIEAGRPEEGWASGQDVRAGRRYASS
jgi:hypothetical protein